MRELKGVILGAVEPGALRIQIELEFDITVVKVIHLASYDAPSKDSTVQYEYDFAGLAQNYLQRIFTGCECILRIHKVREDRYNADIIAYLPAANKYFPEGFKGPIFPVNVVNVLNTRNIKAPIRIQTKARIHTVLQHLHSTIDQSLTMQDMCPRF